MPSHQEITTTGFDHGGKTFEFARVDARPGSQREIHAILSNSALELWEKEQELRGNFEADDIAATVVDSLLGEIDEESLRALEGLIVEKRRDLSIPALRGILHRYRHPSLDFPFLNAVVHAEFRPITAQLAKTSADPVVFVEEAVGVLRELGLRGLFNHGLCSEISDLLRSRREALSPEVFIEYLRGLGLGHTKDIAEFGALLDEAGSIHAMSPRFVTMLMMGWGEIPVERPHLAIEVADHLEDMWESYQPVEKALTLHGLARWMDREDLKSG